MDLPLTFLCLAAFVAGFIDSIVGGGGFVQVPAFFILYPQLGVPYVIGTNRVASAVGTSVAAWNYLRQVKVPWKTVLFAGAGASVASYLGATVQSMIPNTVLKPLILFIIVVGPSITQSEVAFLSKRHLLQINSSVSPHLFFLAVTRITSSPRYQSVTFPEHLFHNQI